MINNYIKNRKSNQAPVLSHDLSIVLQPWYHRIAHLLTFFEFNPPQYKRISSPVLSKDCLSFLTSVLLTGSAMRPLYSLSGNILFNFASLANAFFVSSGMSPTNPSQLSNLFLASLKANTDEISLFKSLLLKLTVINSPDSFNC